MPEPKHIPGVRPGWTYLGTIDNTHYYRVPDSDPAFPDAVWKSPPDRHWRAVCLWDDWPTTEEAQQIAAQQHTD